MTNKEKIGQIIFFTTDSDKSGNTVSIRELKHDMSIIAEWKDNQFKKYLEKKYKEASDSYDKTEAKFYEDRMNYINEIINELFKEG